LVKLIGIFLNDFIVTLNLESFVVFGFEIRIRRNLSKALECIGEMTMVNDERIPGIRMFLITLRQKNMGSEIHRTPPKLRQQLTLDSNVFDILGFCRCGNGRDYSVKADLNQVRFLMIDPHLFGCAK